MTNKIFDKELNELEIALFAIVGILFLECLAIIKGIDGQMFGLAMAAIGGIVGWVFKGFVHKKR